MSEVRALSALPEPGLEEVVVRHGKVRPLAEAAKPRGIEPRDIVRTMAAALNATVADISDRN